MSATDNGSLHLWECPRIMAFGLPSERACGYVVRAVPGESCTNRKGGNAWPPHKARLNWSARAVAEHVPTGGGADD